MEIVEEREMDTVQFKSKGKLKYELMQSSIAFEYSNIYGIAVISSETGFGVSRFDSIEKGCLQYEQMVEDAMKSVGSNIVQPNELKFDLSITLASNSSAVLFHFDKLDIHLLVYHRGYLSLWKTVDLPNMVYILYLLLFTRDVNWLLIGDGSES